MSQITAKDAVRELWMRGRLEWKLHPVQKQMLNEYITQNKPITTFVCARRLGKSYLLCVLALEKCLQQPHAIVKYVCPTKKQVKEVVEDVIRILLQDCPPELKPEFKYNDYKYVFPNGSQIQMAGTDGGHHENLRGSKCLAEDTLIMTPSGPTPIKDIQIGDHVYGYNKDGSVSLTRVVNKFDNGIKEVTEILKKDTKIAACTDDHRWLANSLSSIQRNNLKYYEKQFQDIDSKNDRIVRRLIDIPCGNIHEPHAYAIGAFIGDGCSTDRKGSKLRFSSQNNIIPNKIAETLNCFYQKASGDNYNWNFTTTLEHYKHSSIIKFNHYTDWIKGRYSYQKNFNWNIVDTWDRTSCLSLLAGLLDTDGNVYYNSRENNLEVSFATTNLELAQNIQRLLFKLYQFNASIKENKSGNRKRILYSTRIRSNFTSKRLLKELTPFLALDRKKYQQIYDRLPEKESDIYFKITKGKKYLARTYDLQVDNETHLYLTAHGLVTHNCDFWIVDEAGFCDELQYVVNSILAPTGDTTGARGILASTPSKNSDHDFIEYFVRPAEVKEQLIKHTIYDNPLLSKAKIQEIIDRFPMGEKDPQFRREYLCEIINNSDLSVIPEFTKELEEVIVKNVDRPPFYDAYVSMDIGFKDLTVVLFGYFDFKNACLVIEDELVQDGRTLLIDKFADAIKKRESDLWTNPLSGEMRPPYLRVSDNNNLIMLNQLEVYHQLTFVPTKKEGKEAWLNNMRMKLANRQIIINPRCKTLIYHLRNGTWAKNREKYARSPDAGHYDAIDSLVYMVRNLNENKNPYPPGYGMSDKFNYYTPAGKKDYTPQQQQWISMFKPRTSLKFNK